MSNPFFAPDTPSVDAQALEKLVAALFETQGLAPQEAAAVAHSLVSADLEGVASHGVMLVPLYLKRLQAGSVKAKAQPHVVEDHGALVVLCADQALGQLSSAMAVDVGLARAGLHGVAVVTVRDAFHFGAASYWARRFAAQGMVGMAFSNTRPLMPAPGGAKPVVGNNPMALAFPSASGEPLVVDMAMSASAMGKIRLAQTQGQAIPDGWATNAQGQPTTSASEAIAGMLLPAAGPKGFGLAVAIDLLCGALSGGGVGAAVRPLYAELDHAYNCAHTFIAIDAARLHAGQGIGQQVAAVAQSLRDSPKAAGSRRIYAPGDLERAHRAQLGGRCPMPAALRDELTQLAQQAGFSPELEAHLT